MHWKRHSTNITYSCGSGRRVWDTCCSELCTAEAVHSTSTSRKLKLINLKDLKGTIQAFSTVYTTAVLYFQSLVLVMRACSASMYNVASTYSLNSSGRGTTFSSFMKFMACLLSCGCVRRMCSGVCACEQIARTRSGDKGFKNVPAPARQTPPINPENYTFIFPQDKKWVIQNSCPKAGRPFFGKKGQHFFDSIRRGLRFNRSPPVGHF